HVWRRLVGFLFHRPFGGGLLVLNGRRCFVLLLVCGRQPLKDEKFKARARFGCKGSGPILAKYRRHANLEPVAFQQVNSRELCAEICATEFSVSVCYVKALGIAFFIQRKGILCFAAGIIVDKLVTTDGPAVCWLGVFRGHRLLAVI